MYLQTNCIYFLVTRPMALCLSFKCGTSISISITFFLALKIYSYCNHNLGVLSSMTSWNLLRGFENPIRWRCYSCNVHSYEFLSNLLESLIAAVFCDIILHEEKASFLMISSHNFTDWPLFKSPICRIEAFETKMFPRRISFHCVRLNTNRFLTKAFLFHNCFYFPGLSNR